MRTQVITTASGAEDDEVDVHSAGLSDVGRVRTRNEDQFLVATVRRSLEVAQTSLGADVVRWLPGATQGTVLLVADGMGGGAAGDVASTVAVKAIVEYLCNTMPSAGPASVAQSRLRAQTIPGVRVGLQTALAAGDAEVRRAAGDAPRSGRSMPMGTTATLAYLLWPQLYVAHAGDSRCYLVRAGGLSQLTTDHTFAERYRAEHGVAVDEESPWHHVLWNALGGIRNAVLQPEIRRFTLQPNDALVLCSDGLTKHVPEATISSVVTSGADPAVCCQKLVDLANDAGGTDNVTVVVAQCTPRPARRKG